MTLTKTIIGLMLVGLATGAGGAVAPAAAQDQVVRIDGLVQWIGGQQMVVQADRGPSVGIDLASVPQDEYAGLGVRDRVAVIGTLSQDGRRITGTTVMRSERPRLAR
jgi:hypothetical protein